MSGSLALVEVLLLGSLLFGELLLRGNDEEAESAHDHDADAAEEEVRIVGSGGLDDGGGDKREREAAYQVKVVIDGSPSAESECGDTLRHK